MKFLKHSNIYIAKPKKKGKRRNLCRATLARTLSRTVKYS